MLAAYLGEGFQTAHHRHLQVEDHDVGSQGLDLHERIASVTSRSDNLHPLLVRERPRHDTTHDDGVVDDEHPRDRSRGR